MLSPVTGGFYYGKIVAGIAREVAAVGGRVVLVQTLDAGSGQRRGRRRRPTSPRRRPGTISTASSRSPPRRTANYLDDSQAAGKAVALASDEIEGFDAPSATPDNAAGVDETLSTT